MQDWNVVASAHTEEFGRARRLLGRWGAAVKTDYFNVLVLRVEDVEALLEELRELVEREPGTLNALARVVPCRRTFSFRDATEFGEKARGVAAEWAPALAGRSFHVRMHRRGFKGRISSQHEEQSLAGVVLETLEQAGSPGRIAFDDPDCILSVEMVGNRAGLSLWTREDLLRYPFLGLD